MLIFLLTLPTFAQAEGTRWARIVRTDTYLYATEDCSKQLFALEKSYYAEILQELDKTYFVKVVTQDKSFPNLCGYVLKNEVRVQENAPDEQIVGRHYYRWRSNFKRTLPNGKVGGKKQLRHAKT